MKTPPLVKTSAIVRSFFSEFFKNKWFYGSVGATLIAQSAYTLDTYITAQIVDHLRLFFIGETTAKEVYHQFFLLISIGAITWTFWRINEYAINRF